MSREPDAEGGPELGDGPPPDEFDAIVSGWRHEGQVPRWPDAAEPAPAEPAPWTTAGTAAAPLDEYFVPPEPPPLPRLGPPALVGLALLGLGLVLIVSPGWVGVPVTYGLPLGLIALASGLGWLILRLWPDARWDEDTDGDDGAVL